MDHLHMDPTPLRIYPPHPQVLSLRNFNICNGWGFGIAQAIQAVQIGGFDPMILTETNINDQNYCHNRLG